VANLTGTGAWHGLTEVAAVGLGAGEQRTLSRIASELAASDPNLALALTVFSRLNCGAEMPARQHAGGPRQQAGHSRRSRRPARNRHGRRRTDRVAALGFAAWILITAALITVALVLSQTGHGVHGLSHCTPPWQVTCAGE